MKTFSLAVGLALAAGVVAEDKPEKAVVKAVGTFQPEEVVDVGAQVAGTIQGLGPDPRQPGKAIDYNSVVKKGAVLAQIDPAPFEAKVARAEAALRRFETSLKLAKARVTLAERELQRAKKRLSDRAADVLDVEVAQAALDVARAAVQDEEASVALEKEFLAYAKRQLADATIRSPIDGIVIDRRINVGQAVLPSLSTPSLFLIAANLRRMQLWAMVNEADILKVAEGQPASLTVDARPKDTFQGRVRQVRLNAVNAGGKTTYTVVIDIDDREGKLRPYMTANAVIEVGGR